MKFLAPLAFTTALMTGGLAFAQVPVTAQTLRSISVSGDAKEMLTPDQAVISISVVSKDLKAEVAKEDNDKRVAKLVEVTKKFDIPSEKINTRYVSIQPEYSYEPKTNKQIFQDYAVNRSFVVTVDKIDNVEKLLSAIVEAKLDRVDNVQYQIADPKVAGDRIRAKAFADAKSKAQALADAAGAKLGKVIEINVGGVQPPIFRPMMAKAMPMDMMAGAAESSVAPQLPGEIEQQENVSVVFELE